MRERAENFDPERIIEEILKSNKKQNVSLEKKDKSYYFLENLKTNTIHNYIDNIGNKTKQEMRQELEKKLEEYNTATSLFCDKKNKENLEYFHQLTSSKTKVEELELSIIQLNQENKLLKEQLKSSDNVIFKLQSKFEVFNKLKPIFEEFFKQFPEDNPVQIIKEINEKREASIRLIEDINNLNDKLFNEEKTAKQLAEKNKKVIEDLLNKISQVELENKDKIIKFQKEIFDLKSELSNMMHYKKENINLHNMLFHIYNKLIERLELSKNIKISPELKVIERDFKPDLFNNEEVGRYITTMLVTSYEESSSRMFRETIAYTNMLLRTYCKDELSKRFDPVMCLKKIKEIVEKTQEKKIKVKQENHLLKDKIKVLEIEIKKLNNDIKFSQLQYGNLEKKFNKQFSERILRSKENRNNMIMQKDSKIITVVPQQIFNDEEEEQQEHKKVRPSSVGLSKSLVFTDKKRMKESKDLFITENEKIKSSREINKFNKSKNQRKNLLSASTRPNTGKYSRPKTALNKNVTDDEVIETENSHNVVTNHNYASTFNLKNMELSKNKDKIIRPGNYNMVPLSSDGFQSLVEQTNRLFLYKTKMSNSCKKNIFQRFVGSMESKFNVLNKVKKQTDSKELVLGDKIVVDINSMINVLEKRE